MHFFPRHQLQCLLLFLLFSTAHGGDADPPDPRLKPLILVKIWCLVILFVTTFVAGISPYLVKWNEGLILLGTQFAGGVFLGTALMQFLSDSDDAFDSLISKHYPFAFMLGSVGFLIAMFADCVVLCVYRKQRSRDVRVQGGIQQRKSSSGVGTSQSQIQVDDGTDHIMNTLFFNAISFGDSMLLIIALCFHSIFEGIAIGVMDTQSRAWRALWTVTLHKVFAAIAMGIALLRTILGHPLLSCTAYAFVFAISCPIGVAIGIVIDATAPGIVADWIYAIFMGLASGVFVYVSVDHLLFKGYLPEGTVSVDMPHHKFVAVVLGVAAIAVVMIWDTLSRAYGGG
ncbi:hypothetical protein ACSBR1_027397 [Camellia fascicularis]